MRSCVRFSFLALLVGVLVAVAAPGAQAAVEVEKFVGINCKATAEHCGEKVVGADIFGEPIAETVEPELAESEAQGYRQAAGHVPFGVTDFTIKHTGSLASGTAAPTGVVTHVRVDVAPGLATSPAAVPQCTMAEFGAAEAVPGTGFYAASKCKEGPGLNGIGPESTVIGRETATVFVEPLAEKSLPPDVTLSGTLYNLVQPEPPAQARASYFGAALKLPIGLTKGILEGVFKKSQPAIENAQYYAHTIVEGNVEWGQEAKGTNAGDYHDYFEVKVSPSLPVIRSRQEDYGTAGNGAFITNATSCPGNHTTFLTLEGVSAGSAAEVKERLESANREKARRPYTTLLGLNGCGLVPFEPSFSLTPSTTASDQPDGISATAGLTRHPSEEIDSAQVKTASIKLPEGMTLNPSAAAGLTACTPAQARIHSETPGTACPTSSLLGTVSLEVPTLPPGSLSGNVYLGGPESGPITGPPYIVYVDAESARYAVSVRLKAETIPNEATGQVTTVFNENPEQPFTSLTMHFKEGALAPIANPLTCGVATAEASFLPFTLTAAKTVGSAFTPTGCPNPLPFSLTQSTVNQTSTAGGHTNYTFNLGRADGQQYLSQVKTILPQGLVGAIPTVTQCTEAQATSNTCPATSQIGTAAAISGSGPTPFTFGNGVVYLTGPYQGAPFGLSIVIPAVAGPFNLGPVTTRATINIDPTTTRVTTTANVPTIVKGIPTRLRGISVSVNKQGFLFNPTSCILQATDSTLTGFTPGSSATVTQNISSPFQVGSCNLLKFKPAFKAKTSALTSKANGASLETTINEVAGQANIKSVKVQLPLQLPSRLTTLQKACSEAQFAANPFHCPSGSFVGGARANTPTLPGKLVGPAILVSHGGAAFPDLDLVLEANGVRTILVGNTDIKKGITTTTFAATPDVPVSSITVNLPLGAHSALAANGNLCARPLVMPTTITGQNGTVVKQNTKIAVGGCGVRIVGHKVVGNTAYLTVQTFGAGRISGKGNGLATVFRRFSSSQQRATLKVPLSRGGRSRHRPFTVRLRVGFVPKARGAKSSVSFVTVSFR
ncbi:MAG TPA: hypothetical protein VGO29_06500 [Solirubrobacteraceae bacterium]|jgi:hypothetical protein|nr:hypothetical protein [Solirubrobacteraceae bacterium]